MKHLTILVPAVQNNIITIAAAYEILSTANACYKEAGRKEIFAVQLAGTSEQVQFSGGLFTAQPHVHISAITKTDLIIFPSISSHSYQVAVDENTMLINWARDQYKNGAEIASLCTGAFMLASSGLLDGKICSTHWAAADTFKTMFPNVNLQPDRLITDEHGIYTNGGAYSFLNLMIYLVEKYYDRQTAVYCSKIFQIEIDRQCQSAFIIFQAQKQHGDEMIQQVQEYIENKLHEKLSIDDLSSKFAVGRRHFDRRFLKATGNTPGEYLQRVKMEAAKKALESTGKTIGEVMRQVGYGDEKAFREVFRKITGMTPKEYKDKYNKNALA